MAWNPFGVAFELAASNGGVTRISATQFTVKVNASWEVYYEGNSTNWGMKASAGGGSVILNPSGTYSSGSSGSFTGTYSVSGNGSTTATITVTFTNWQENWQGTVTDSATTTVSFNVTVPAWTSYTVSYSANGGSGAPNPQTKWKDQTLKLQTGKPTRTGYTFSHWNTKSDNTGTTYASGANYVANAGATLYAIWTENYLTVNYYSNNATSFGGTSTPLNTVNGNNVLVYTSKYYYDDNYNTYGLGNYSNSTGSLYMTRTGYTATKYWGTSTSGGTLIHEDTGYSTGQALAVALGKNLSSGNASINLYAQWQINTYTVNYNANKGTGSISSQSIKWQEIFTISNNSFKREGYKFIGWHLYRNDDSKWYVPSLGWKTEDEIVANGYNKKLYINQEQLTLNTSWIEGNENAKQFTFYAVWEISGVVYIDNGTVFEPYLAYIDNGTEWELYLMYVDDGVNWNIIS